MVKIKDKEYFAKGKRYLVYTGYYKNKKAIIKEPISKINTIENEARFLKLLNKYKIGPKLFYYDEKKLVCEFIEGIKIIDWLKINNKSKIKLTLKKILDQCRKLDELKIDKKELTNPYKHIIINKKPIMIDFERCKFVKNPKNVTQFCQFLTSINVYLILKEKGIGFDKDKLIENLRLYKKYYDKNSYYSILRIIL